MNGDRIARFVLVFSILIFMVAVAFQLNKLDSQITQLHKAISDYNYIASSRNLPQIGMSVEGGVVEGGHVLPSEEYLKERK